MGIKTLRAKFLVALVLMFLILGGIFAVTGITMIRSIVLKEAQDHVESDLRVAWSEYAHKLDDVTRILQLIGGKTILLSAIKDSDETAITPRLELLMKLGHWV